MDLFHQYSRAMNKIQLGLTREEYNMLDDLVFNLMGRHLFFTLFSLIALTKLVI